ncbi:MAG TPA: ATP-binding protein [Spirochaetota bacterium]|nr:ATP-binding protein [Spirochaetota bacterium]
MNNIMQCKITPEWENLDKVREKTGDFLKLNHLDKDIMDAIMMNICELTENAIKYGKFDEQNNEIRTRVTITPSDIIVEVSSPLKENDNYNPARLDRVVQWIRGYQNPFEAYIEKLKEVAVQPQTDGESGLGVVRIAYEGQSIIDFYINEKGIISVSAVYHLPKRRC